jgi:hypothetical protein
MGFLLTHPADSSVKACYGLYVLVMNKKSTTPGRGRTPRVGKVARSERVSRVLAGFDRLLLVVRTVLCIGGWLLSSVMDFGYSRVVSQNSSARSSRVSILP